MSTLHLYPENDVIDHDTDSDDCWCGPKTSPTKEPDGSIGWVILHNSIDGREFAEADYDGATLPSESVKLEIPEDTD